MTGKRQRQWHDLRQPPTTHLSIWITLLLFLANLYFFVAFPYDASYVILRNLIIATVVALFGGRIDIALVHFHCCVWSLPLQITFSSKPNSRPIHANLTLKSSNLPTIRTIFHENSIQSLANHRFHSKCHRIFSIKCLASRVSIEAIFFWQFALRK